jgi:hypothetical protein
MLKIFDHIRRKYVALTPEEWVRQHLINYLVNHLGYPKGLIAIEKEIKIHGLRRRPDVVVFDRNASAVLVAECKAPEVTVSQQVFDQAARYNLVLDCKVFVLTNGLQTYCCMPKRTSGEYQFLEHIPDYSSALSLTTL